MMNDAQNLKITVLETCDSTQNIANQMQSVSIPELIVTRVQTQGYGYTGKWVFYPGSFAGSLVFPMKYFHDIANKIELVTMTSLLDLVRSYDETSKFLLKHPNDIMMNGKKVCGVIANIDRNVCIGIGLNVGFGESDEFALIRKQVDIVEVGKQIFNMIIANYNRNNEHVYLSNLIQLNQSFNGFKITGIQPPMFLKLYDGSREIIVGNLKEIQ